MEEEKLSESSIKLELDRGLQKRQLLGGGACKEEINPADEDLIKEIALVELDIMCLERYLLSMYRKTFAKSLEAECMKIGSLPRERKGSQVKEENGKPKEMSSTTPILTNFTNPLKECDDAKLVDSTILRCHSSLSHAAYSFRASPSVAALDSYHSLPLSMLEASTSNGTITEHLVTSSSKHYHCFPSQLSEEMIKSISAIYCQLADPPFFAHDLSSSPISVSSSTLESFPHGQQQCRENSDSKEFLSCFVRMVEVQGLCRDSHSLNAVERMLKQFRQLVSKLEEVDPRDMRHEEKLAFWINVHNSLAMHAFLVHGIPKSNLKRASLLLKAAYNIGGNTVSVDMIQNSILRCQLTRPGQWLQSLFFTKQRFKAGDARKGYAIEYPDPRLRFALCLGNHSDPLLRLYTSNRVFEELEVAKEEYIQANIRVHKQQKLLLPKNVESYIKELNLSPSSLFETIEQALPSHLRNKLEHPEQRKLWKKIDWIPHNFTFRYFISHELVQ